MNNYMDLLQNLSFDASCLRGFSEAWLPVLLDAAIKGMALLALAAALALAMRKASAAVRQAVWLLALAGLIVLPPASAALPSWGVLPGWLKIEITNPAERGEGRGPQPLGGEPLAIEPRFTVVGGPVSPSRDAAGLPANETPDQFARADRAGMQPAEPPLGERATAAAPPSPALTIEPAPRSSTDAMPLTTASARPATGAAKRESEARAAEGGAARVIKAGDADTRERFLEIERFARLPIKEQAEGLPHFYRELAPPYMSIGIELILSSFPTDPLNRDPNQGFKGNDEVWAQQLAEAASKFTPEQVADKLGEPIWINVATRARAIQTLKAHAKETESLIQADLASRRKIRVQRAGSVIIAMNSRAFTKQLVEMFLADDDLSDLAGGALSWLHDDSVYEPILERVRQDPNFLRRCAGHMQGYLWRKPAHPTLLKLLEHDDANVRYSAANAVYECTDAKLAPAAARFAKEKEPRFRVQAAYLGANLPADAFAAVRGDLAALLNDADESVRIEALRCFAQQKDLLAGPVILEYLRSAHAGPAGQHGVVVMQALMALAGQHFGYDMHNWGPATPANARAIAKFEEWLKAKGVAVPHPSEAAGTSSNASPTTRPRADQAEIDGLIKRLGSEKFTDREAAQKELAQIGLPAVPALRRAEKDADVERSTRAAAAYKQIEGASWGQPVQGLQARLRPLLSSWKAGQAPELALDIRNGGKTAIEYSNAAMLYCQIEVDGQWHSWAKDITLALPAGMLKPGEEYTLKVQITDSWATSRSDEGGATTKAATKPLTLSASRHVVRVSFTGYPGLGKHEDGIRFISNEAWIDIAGGDSATRPAGGR
jgi:HEAT repeat protein